MAPKVEYKYDNCSLMKMSGMIPMIVKPWSVEMYSGERRNVERWSGVAL